MSLHSQVARDLPSIRFVCHSDTRSPASAGRCLTIGRDGGRKWSLFRPDIEGAALARCGELVAQIL
jgi:hypothetical protein